MASPRKAIHDASKSASRDLAKALLGRIVEIKPTLIAAAVYDSVTAASIEDYTTSSENINSPTVEAAGSLGIDVPESLLLLQDEAFAMGYAKTRISNIWAPPSTPRIVHVRPGIDKTFSSNICAGDWITLIPMGTGDTYCIGNVISHRDSELGQMGFMNSTISSEGSSMSLKGNKGG